RESPHLISKQLRSIVEKNMIGKLIVALAATALLASAASAQPYNPMEHKPRVVKKKGPDGKVYSNKMDGCFSTCMRDGQKMGYTAFNVRKYCDGRVAAGAVRRSC